MSPVVFVQMLINTDDLTSWADYSSFNSVKAAHGVNYHGREYDYCVSHLVIWLSPKGVSSIDAVSTNTVLFFSFCLPCNKHVHYYHFHFRLN